jgi:hypothetical protein
MKRWTIPGEMARRTEPPAGFAGQFFRKYREREAPAHCAAEAAISGNPRVDEAATVDSGYGRRVAAPIAQGVMEAARELGLLY